jgi:predicted Zn-dependent peptidase
MMFKGTPSYNPGDIDRIIEVELGGALNAYTSKDQTAYFFYNLERDDLEKCIDICGEMVFKANLDHEEFDGKMANDADGNKAKAKGERDVVLEEIKRSNDNIHSRKWDLLFSVAYPGQPHGRPVLGTEDTLSTMTVEQLAAYRDEFYVPNNVVFSASGPVAHDEFVALIEKKFAGMKFVDFPPLPAPEYRGGTGIIEMEAAEICSVVLAMKGVAASDPEVFAYEVLGEILGNGASSRLYKELVIKRGLTSDVATGNIGYKHSGMFCVVASIDAEKSRELVDAIYEELQKLGDDLTEGELAKARSKIEMDAISSVETNRGACDTYGRDTLILGEPLNLEDIISRIHDLEVDDIKKLIVKILEGRPTLAMVVPVGTDRALLPDDRLLQDCA